MNYLNELFDIIKLSLNELYNLAWASVQFKKSDFAIGAAVILLAAFSLAGIWRLIRRHHRRSYYEHSGYHILPKDQPGILYRIINKLPALVFAVASVFMFLAMADPYFTENYQNKFLELREIIYLRDISNSMSYAYEGRTRGTVLQDFILELISDRKDKNDRSAYVTFDSSPHIYANFTVDNNSLLFSVTNGPIDNGGSTYLNLGLATVIHLFDDKGDGKITEQIKSNPNIKRRSVVIFTDGASDTDPEPQLIELKKKNIVPYLVFVKADQKNEDSDKYQRSLLLLQQVEKYDGKAFLATDKTSREEIRKKLEELHPSVVGIKTFTNEVHIYRYFLVTAIFLYAVALALRLLLARFFTVI